ncbi:MAG: 6-carboxytetrahydropterin synthase QueD [Desulfohalobiaceae bacterium]|nr:6-carboxytetrahydropterin synthase QueD [Desulfohalobiaceae bacterium]
MSQTEVVYRIEVEEEFSSSHQLRNYGGKCEELHGHNFRVLAEVEGGELDPDTGLLIDFKELRGNLRSILQELDHKHLNELPEFEQVNPSSENLARHIYLRLEEALSGGGVRLRKVCVLEKKGSRATFMRA